MGQYGYLVCPQCKQLIFLGKIIKDENKQPLYFHIGDEENILHSHNLMMNRVIWKFLAQHAGHSIKVFREYEDPEDYMGDDYIEVGGDRIIDISFEEYLKDWPG